MIKPLIKKISFYVGVGLVFAAGLLYILLADILINTQSLWLMLSVLFAFGSAVCAVLSERYRGSGKALYVLKGVAVALAVCFIGILLMIMLISFSPAKEIPEGQKVSAFVQSFTIRRVQLRGETGKYLKDGYKTMLVYVICMVVAFLGLAAQVTELALSAVIKEE